MPIMAKIGFVLSGIGLLCCFIPALYYSSGGPIWISKLNEKLVLGIEVIAFLSGIIGLFILAITI